MPAPPALLREARQRAGLSQRQLAHRARTAQSVVARIERGQTSPSWDTLARLLAAAGFAIHTELDPRSSPRSHMLDDVARILALPAERRLDEVRNVNRFVYAARVASAAPLDLERLITTLAQHRMRFVLVGALAARLHGFPRVTTAADITPASDPENLARLAAALRELQARVYTESVPEGLPFDCSAQALARADLWNLVTAAGRLDLAFVPSGTGGYDDLARGAVRFKVYGMDLLAARLEDIIRSKEAAGRPQDRQDVVLMREMLKRRPR